MHVITRKRLNEFARDHPDALSALEHWYRVMKANRFANFAQLRELFPSADQVGNKTVFNIGGNKYRLIAALHYNRARVYIRAILVHRDYDKGTWKQP
jgi:mRNA interferase HigB